MGRGRGGSREVGKGERGGLGGEMKGKGGSGERGKEAWEERGWTELTLCRLRS